MLVKVLDVIWTGLTFLLTVYQIPKIIGGIMVITLILVKGAPNKGLLIQRSKKVAFVLYFSIIFYIYRKNKPGFMTISSKLSAESLSTSKLPFMDLASRHSSE